MDWEDTASERPADKGPQAESEVTMVRDREQTADDQLAAPAPREGSEQDLSTRRNVLSTGVGKAVAAGATTTLGVVLAGFATTGTAEAATKKKPTKKQQAATSTKKTTINVNGKSHTVQVPPETPILYVLRNNLRLRGPKFGCGLLECGACAVLNNGKQIRACQTALASIKPTDKIVTLDGLGDSYHGKGKKNGLHPVQQAWIEEQVPQCGYCQSGQMIQAASLLNENKKPTKEEIKKNMNGHLCRCGTYNAILRAVTKASEAMS